MNIEEKDEMERIKGIRRDPIYVGGSVWMFAKEVIKVEDKEEILKCPICKKDVGNYHPGYWYTYRNKGYSDDWISCYICFKMFEPTSEDAENYKIEAHSTYLIKKK